VYGEETDKDKDKDRLPTTEDRPNNTRQLTAAVDFVAYFCALSQLHVKQIFIALFYLHFLFALPDTFHAFFRSLFSLFFLCEKFTLSLILMSRLGMEHFYYLTFRFILSL